MLKLLWTFTKPYIALDEEKIFHDKGLSEKNTLRLGILD